MTKRRWKSESAVIHASGANAEREVLQAVVEQLFETRGRETVARFLAEHLRIPVPTPDVIATVARWLDPQADDYIKLVVVARPRGKADDKARQRRHDCPCGHLATTMA
jgi:hypothetical protein